MSELLQERLQNIEKRLDELTKILTQKQQKIFEKKIIDNDEFQRLFRISPGTASNWRTQGLIAFSQINNKIIYKIDDVIKLIEDNYRPAKK